MKQGTAICLVGRPDGQHTGTQKSPLCGLQLPLSSGHCRDLGPSNLIGSASLLQALVLEIEVGIELTEHKLSRADTVTVPLDQELT